ncbi:hypothetical protein NP493_318g01001 [Ridgeia piscesae]|uniref:Uncharacterized protein n=1 Tax=Ridgeia piscesae TaxID=27915 RepID=A0AAD9NWC7_RIDPI|nr:hypothetical protein NP493_318g01001 [Ridgeia piscesae]
MQQTTHIETVTVVRPLKGLWQECSWPNGEPTTCTSNPNKEVVRVLHCISYIKLN